MSKTQQEIDGLAQELVTLARAANISLSTAESCTGGGIATAITEIPGCSRVFKGGIIAYADFVKTSQLHVPADLIEKHGAVSEPVALAMAEGANTALGTDMAVSVTGIAGPGGGTDDKPVGTVWIAIARKGCATAAHLFELPNTGRADIRLWATREALKMLCEAIENHKCPGK